MRIAAILTIVFFSLLSHPSFAEITSQEIHYQADGIKLKGFLAFDNKQKEPRPGVIVVHEWWGHNDYARKRARMLAELGYVAFALDMYGDGKQANHPKQASVFSAAIKKDLATAEKRFIAAYDILSQQKQTDKTQIAAIGYCFGGGIVLAMARRGLDLQGVVSFHGSPNVGAPAQKGKIKANLLVLNGGADSFVKAEQKEAFKMEMDAVGAVYEWIDYDNAKHAFTNPDANAFGKNFNIPLAYNATADRMSWIKMQDFFNEIFH